MGNDCIRVSVVAIFGEVYIYNAVSGIMYSEIMLYNNKCGIRNCLLSNRDLFHASQLFCSVFVLLCI